MTRSRQSLNLARNPIVLALGQVVTSPILDIERYIPKLQEEFRHAGYPLFERIDLQSIQLGPNQSPTIQSESKWVFLNRERSQSISIGQSFIVLEQNSYSSFDSFVDALVAALRVIGGRVKPALVQRIGFRRVSLVEGSEMLAAERFIQPSMQGVDNQEFTMSGQHQYEFRGETNDGNLMIRVIRPAPAGVLPPELLGGVVSVREPVTLDNSATIDIDHFAARTEDFEPAELLNSFWRLHDASDLAFRQTVTEAALAHWSQDGG